MNHDGVAFSVFFCFDEIKGVAGEDRGKEKRIFDSIQIGFDEDWQSRLFDIVLMVLTLVNLFSALFPALLFWWAVSTLLTVGYRDIYPITIPGRVFGIVITFSGVGMVAIPTGIFSSGFVEQYTRMKSLKDYSISSVGGKLLIPDGVLALQVGDMVLMYTKKICRDIQMLEI